MKLHARTGNGDVAGSSVLAQSSKNSVQRTAGHFIDALCPRSTLDCVYFLALDQQKLLSTKFDAVSDVFLEEAARGWSQSLAPYPAMTHV